MDSTPLVTIVTPSFNQGRFLEATIQSVFAQDYPNIEYIIIDGGSTDESVPIIQKYADKLTYWESTPDEGQTEAINKGFAKSQGQIMAWLNSDDTYLPHAVSEAVAYFNSHPDVGLVYGQADFIDEQGRVIGQFQARQTNLTRLRRGFVHIPQQAAFWRSALWQQVGPLDPAYYFAMDYDLWQRLAQVTTLHYQPSLWANFRLHGDSKTIAEDDRCWPEMLRIHRREGGSRFSVIYAKYHLRKLLAPWLNWRRKQQLTLPKESSS